LLDVCNIGIAGKTMISQLLKTHRTGKRIHQKELARELGYTSPQFVSNWERGISEPPLKDAKKICGLLGISEKKYKQILIKRYKDKVEEAFK